MRRLSTILILLALLTGAAHAGLSGTAGGYRLDLVTDPAVIPVGPADLVLTLTADGAPVDGATVTTFTQMPGMPMGEKKETAKPTGMPGVYKARAAFGMAGAFTVTVTVTGPKGTSEAVFQVKTGQNTASDGGGGFVMPLLLGLALAGLVFGLYKNRDHLNRNVLGAILLIVVMVAVAVWAVRNLRRPGAMTPIEAQVMEMNLPAPVGSTPVELAKATRGPLQDVVRYSGQAVAFEDVVVSARTTGVIQRMPWYVGDSVRQGQELVRLDVSQLEPKVAASRAQERMAEASRSAVESEHVQNGADVDKARAERVGAVAASEAAQARLRDATAEVTAAQAQVEYRRASLLRTQDLQKAGALSLEELQKEQADAADAEARLRAAHAKVTEAEADLRTAQSSIAAREAEIRSTEAARETGARRIAEGEAGIAAARAQTAAAEAEQGYASVTATVDGVVTERMVAPGTLVQAGQGLLRVARIDPIRLQANVAQADLARLKPGDPVRVRDAQGRVVQARVTSLRPAVDPAARQGLVEAVVPNADHRFLPGAYLSMEIVAQQEAEALLVPSSAVTTNAPAAEGGAATDTRSFVWVARGAAGSYEAHRTPVEPGASDGTRTAILSGLQEGDMVIASGFAFLKDGDPVAGVAPAARVEDGFQHATIKVSKEGFTPASLDLKPGVPARLTFVRVDDQNCGTEVLFPELGIQKSLPLNQPVVVEIPARAAGGLNFTCGMNMLKGKVLVR